MNFQSPQALIDWIYENENRLDEFANVTYRGIALPCHYLRGFKGGGMYLPVSPHALDWLLDNGLKEETSMSESMKKIVMTEVIDALIEGAPIPQFAANLQAKIPGMSESKAEQIATQSHELCRTSNGARHR